MELDICNNIQISISVPVQIEENVESLIDSLAESGYNIFNENDSFYNDICATYTTQNGTDILLSDRKKDIYEVSQSQTMCQTGCELESYNTTTKKAKCNCSVKEETITHLDIDDLFDKKEIAKSFYNTLSNSNFQVLKCYKLIMDFSLISDNYGEITMLLFLITFTILSIIYFIKGQKEIHSYINNILKYKNNNYNKKNNTFKINDNNHNNYNNKNHNSRHNRHHNKTNISQLKMKRNNTKEKKNSYRHIIPTSRNKSTKNTLKNAHNHAPPKRIKDSLRNKKIKNKNNLLNKKSSEKLISKHNINNNIFLNVQVLKSEKKNKKKQNINNSKAKEKKIEKIKTHKSSKSNDLIVYYNSKNLLNTRKNSLNKIQDINYKNLNDQEMNTLEYNDAIKYDKRTYFQYYWSLLKKKQLILFTFLSTNDYNLRYVKFALFIVSLSLYFTINGFFFSDDTMHKVYVDNGAFNLLYQIPQILFSSVISAIINMILKQLSLSEKNILKLKEDRIMKNSVEKSKKIERCLKIKFIIFFILGFILMIFFLYFISCFCAVYVNTQIILLKDTLISFCTSMLYPFGLDLVPGFFRIPALRAQKKDKNCLYKLSLIISLFI